MTTTQHKDEVVAKRQPTSTDTADRYAKASAQLRKTIRDDKVYEVANAWALEQCRLAEQFDWSSLPSRQTLEAGKSAAKLATLHSYTLHKCMAVAEQQSGVKLGVDAAALAKYLRAFAEQCTADNVRCGPLMMKFTNKNQRKMPPPAVALAIALWHDFGQIPDDVKHNEKFAPWVTGPITNGACLKAAVLFANAALKPLKFGTNENAVKQWRKNNKGRLRYWGFRK
jgi:hypothetical protein